MTCTRYSTLHVLHMPYIAGFISQTQKIASSMDVFSTAYFVHCLYISCMSVTAVTIQDVQSAVLAAVAVIIFTGLVANLVVVQVRRSHRMMSASELECEHKLHTNLIMNTRPNQRHKPPTHHPAISPNLRCNPVCVVTRWSTQLAQTRVV